MSDDETSRETDERLLEEDAQDLYENAPCGYISTRPDGTIVKVNRTFLTWTGYAREELVARRRFQDLLTIGYRIYHETHYAPLLQMQGFVNEIALDLVCRDRRQLPILVNSVLRRGADGRPGIVRTTIFNVTERKEYERELLLARKKAEHAARVKADFLSMVSHDIRTPLSGIVGATHLLQQTDPTPRQQKYIRVLKSSSENLLNLINHILDFSRIESGRVTLEERPFDLRQLLYDTLASVNPKAEEKNLPLAVDIDERVPQAVIGDPVKIGQILSNLVGNAVKFTEKGYVAVAVGVREEQSDAVLVHFSVIDTGIGIPEDRLPHIFDEFTQASYDVGMKYGGTGLGLAISRKLVELHGSRLTVESTVGRGSTFTFELPLKVAPGPGVTLDPFSGAVDPERIRGAKVLLAEDNKLNVFIVERMLQRWGVDIEVVDNGRQAVERVTQGEYDVVLMDLLMPEMDGVEATKAIRESLDDRVRDTPIIALSAASRADQEHRVERAGFTDYLEKPLTPRMLAEKIALYARRQRTS